MEQELNMSSKMVWESIKAYTVQCSACSKWRFVPTKEKYEEIREKIKEEPFKCEKAREWQPDVSCENESDVKQDNTNWRWAMDKPSIPKTPNGWQRVIRGRCEGGTKFADVYYVAPSNKRLRSMVELTRYLYRSPHYEQEGVEISQFSFQSPVPLDEKYLKKIKRAPRFSHSSSHAINANPISCFAPYEDTDPLPIELEKENPANEIDPPNSANPDMLDIVPYVDDSVQSIWTRNRNF